MRLRSGISTYSAVALAFLVLLFASVAASLPAKGAREFAGFYRILQTTNQGNKVELKLSLRVINYTGADVKGATISLKSSLPHGVGDDPRDPEAAWEKEQPTFTGVTLHFNEYKPVPPLEATFTIPLRDYQQWMKGAKPNFVIEFTDAAGTTRHEAIELTRHF
jgi:hypothetical protein